MRELIRSSVALLSDRKLVLLHVAGNALLFAVATMWLLIPEAHAWQLLFAAITGLAILFVTAWLHCATLAYGRNVPRDLGQKQGPTQGSETLHESLRASVSRVPVFAGFIVVLAFLMNLVSCCSDQSWQISGYLFTKLPHFLQSSIGEARLNNWVEMKFSALTWFVLPALFLPFLSLVSASRISRRGCGIVLRTYLRWKYWVATAVGALIGVWLPSLIANWAPVHGLGIESVSMVLRLTTAYLLVISAWLMTSGMVGGFLDNVSSVENPRRDTAR